MSLADLYCDMRRPELMQETHSCFFSLLRDIICSTSEHRMSLVMLEDRVKAWAVSPISPLNDWYSAAVVDTTGFLHSALAFLCGEYPGALTIVLYLIPQTLK